MRTLLVFAAAALSTLCHAGIEPLLPLAEPRLLAQLEDVAIQNTASIGHRHAVDALLRAICVDPASASYMMRLSMSTHPDFARATDRWRVELAVGTDVPPEAANDYDAPPPHVKLESDVLEATTTLLSAGWCSLRVGEEDQYHPRMHAPALSHVIFRAVHEMLSRLDPVNGGSAGEHEASPREAFSAAGAGNLNDAQLADLARRAARLLMVQSAEDLPAQQGLEAAIVEYRAAWADALALRLPRDLALQREIDKLADARASKSLEEAAARERAEAQAQEQRNQRNQALAQGQAFAESGLAAESKSESESSASGGAAARAAAAVAARAVSQLGAALSMEMGTGLHAQLGSQLEASIEAAGSVEAWELRLLSTASSNADEASLAANGPAIIQRLTNAYVALATHKAFDNVHRAFGALLSTMCGLEEMPQRKAPPGMKQQKVFVKCDASERANMARVFASVTLGAVHQFAWGVHSQVIDADGHGDLWDLQEDEAARSAAHALFGLQSVLLQVRDVCAIEDVEGMPASLADADELRNGLFGDRSSLGSSREQLGLAAVDPNAAKQAGKASPSPQPAGAAPAQGVSMLRGAAHAGLHPEHKLSTKLLVALGLAVDARAAGNGQGVTLTQQFLQMSEGARAAIEGALLARNGRPFDARMPPELSPAQSGVERLPRDFVLREDDFAFGLSDVALAETSLYLPPQPPAQPVQPNQRVPEVNEAALEHLFALLKPLARFLMLARITAAASDIDGSDGIPESRAPPPPPTWLYAAAQLAYALDGVGKLHEVGGGAPVIKYSEDKATLTDKGKWQDRRLRVWHHGITFADDSARAPAPGTKFDRIILHSAVSALLVPAPRRPASIADAALTSVEARHAEGRLCGVIAAGEAAKARRRGGGSGSDAGAGHVDGDGDGDAYADAWAEFDVFHDGEGMVRLYSDGAQYVPRPNAQTRYYSFCTRGKVTDRDTPDMRVAWLRDAEGLAATFCAAAHNSGLSARAKLEQWWYVQVLRAATDGASRSSISKSAAQALRAGGLDVLDCSVLLEGGHLIDEARVRNQQGLQPQPARRGAAAAQRDLLAVAVSSTAGSPPDVSAPWLIARGASAAKLALEKLADTGKRVGSGDEGLKMDLVRGFYRGVMVHGLTPAFESELMAKYAKEKAASATAMRPAGVVGLQPSLEDRRFWAAHARMTAGGREVETSIDDATLAALWVAIEIGVREEGKRTAKAVGARGDALERDFSYLLSEETFSGVYADHTNQLLIIGFKALTGKDKGDWASGPLLMANLLQHDRDRWRNSARPRIERALKTYPGYSVVFTGYCMGGHMALIASEVFRAPAVLFNPAPRVAAALKLAAAWTLAAPLQVANILTLGVSRKIGNAFNSRGVAGMSRPMTGFWRVIAPRQRGANAGFEETLEWFSTMKPLPGNGMTIVHATAGDRYPAMYFNPGVTGYELHLYPSVARRSAVGAHDMTVLGMLPRRTPGTPPASGARPPGPLQFPDKQGGKDSEDITLEYPQACLAIYGKWTSQLHIVELQPAGASQANMKPQGTKLEELLQVGDNIKRNSLSDAEKEVAELNRRNVFARGAIKMWRAVAGAAQSHVLGGSASGKTTSTGQASKSSNRRNAVAGDAAAGGAAAGAGGGNGGNGGNQ